MNALCSRRHILQSTSSGIGWLAFSALAQAKSGLGSKTAHFAPRAKRVIFLTMRGGPSHVDLFDYKPELAAKDGKTAVIVGKVTDDVRMLDCPKMSVCALGFTENARKRIVAAGGECISLDELALRAP